MRHEVGKTPQNLWKILVTSSKNPCISNYFGPSSKPRTCEVHAQKYSRLRCLLRVKGLVVCFYLGWSGSILQFRQNIIKVGSESWLLVCSSNITLSLLSYTGSALKRELNFCNCYLSLLYFWLFGQSNMHLALNFCSVKVLLS